MLLTILATASILSEPPTLEAALIAPPPIGASCAAQGERVKMIQRNTPDGEPVPRAYEMACRAGKIVAVLPPSSEPMRNLYQPNIGCQAIAKEIGRRVDVAMQGHRSAAEYAVIRDLGGCGVPTPVGYHPDYLAPGAADPQSAKPAGERPRKR